MPHFQVYVFLVSVCVCMVPWPQVPVSWGPAKHRSTQIDTDKTLPGTSDTPVLMKPAAGPESAAAGRSHTCKKSFQAVPGSKGTNRHAASSRTAAAAATIKAAELEPPPATIYKTDFCPDGSEEQRLSRLTATRRTLQAGSEWALLDQLEQSMADRQVGCGGAARTVS